MPPSLCSGGMCCRDYRRDVRLTPKPPDGGCFIWPLPRLHSGASASAVGVALARLRVSFMVLVSPLLPV